MKIPKKQPKPKGRGPAIVDLVKADLDARKTIGIRTYGEPLMAHNGRDALQDLLEELLDAVCYLRQYIEEQKEENSESTDKED